jgi:acyl carrier protein
MNKESFIKSLADLLVADPTKLTDTTLLSEFSAWDSMGKMAVLTLVDTDVGVRVPPNWIDSISTIGDILNLVEPYLVK